MLAEDKALPESKLAEIQDARRIAFVLSQVEQQLGFRDVKDLPLSARIENALQGAMAAPIEEWAFEMLHLLSAEVELAQH